MRGRRAVGLQHGFIRPCCNTVTLRTRFCALFLPNTCMPPPRCGPAKACAKVCDAITSVDGETCFNVQVTAPLDERQAQALAWYAAGPCVGPLGLPCLPNPLLCAHKPTIACLLLCTPAPVVQDHAQDV